MTTPADEIVEKVVQATLGGMEMLSIAIGDRVGYYRAMDGTPRTSAGLAAATGTSERYAREWLEQQAVLGYLEVTEGDAQSRTFMLRPGVAEALARPEELTSIAPLTRMIAAAGAVWTRIADGARTGRGLGWAEYGPDMRESQADINRPPLQRLLADEWVRTGLPELYKRLDSGEARRAADVGCGGGWAGIGLAGRFPQLTVDGFDVDPPTVQLARRNVAEAGLQDRVRILDQDLSRDTPSAEYDLVLAVECIHDMAQPVPVLSAMRRMVRPDGVVLVVDEKVADEFTATADDVERIMYGYSTLICLPDGMAGSPTVATGTMIRRPVLRRYALEAGFTEVETLPVEHDMWRFYRLA